MGSQARGRWPTGFVSMSLRSSAGLRASPEGPQLDFRWFEFLYELGAIAARGEDIRPRVFEEPTG